MERIQIGDEVLIIAAAVDAIAMMIGLLLAPKIKLGERHV